MKEVALVFLGSGIGGALRYCVGLLFAWLFPLMCFPWATMTVNLLGSFLIGVFLSMQYSGGLFFVAIIGFCGGFTTFSALSSEGVAMLRAGHWAMFATYFILSIFIGLLAAWLGFSLGTKIG